MKTKHKSLMATLCGAILSLLGFASCDPFGMQCEYGTPSLNYKLSGTVTDIEGTPIEGIRVIVPDDQYDLERNCFIGDTVFTDALGHYAIPEREGSFAPAPLGILFDDVDGDAHGGSFASDSLTTENVCNAPRKQYKKGDGHWYEGGFEYAIDMTLKKQE